MSAKKIAITNEKGGCGKTTTAVNVSAILAERGYRVLLIDADPQSYSTMYYGLYAPENLSLSDVLFHGEKPEQAISSTEFGVDVLRSSTALMEQAVLKEYISKSGERKKANETDEKASRLAVICNADFHGIAHDRLCG